MNVLGVSILFLHILSTSTTSTTTPTPCLPLKVVDTAGPDMGEYWLAEHGSDQAEEYCGNGCLYRNIMGEEFCFKNGPGVVDNFVYKHDGL